MNADRWADSVPRGWRDLVRDLVRDLDAIAAREGLEYEISDMKEKWGTLSVFLSHYPQPLETRVAQAEEQSARVCCGCGGPAGELRRHRGWVNNLCPTCTAVDTVIMNARIAAHRRNDGS